MSEQQQSTENEALAAALAAADPDPYYGDAGSDVAYYGEFAAELIAAGWRVVPPGAQS